MNTAEKLAATYLRLNGFLLLPHFTVFQGSHHGHVDLIGLRAKDSFSGFNGKPFLMDETLFEAISQTGCPEPKSKFLGLVAEVKTNKKRDIPDENQVVYVQKFLGNVPMAKLSFRKTEDSPQCVDGVIHIGNRYALKWILQRIRSMKEMGRLQKWGSWTLSEETLADIMVLERMDAFLTPDLQRPKVAR